MVRIGFLGSGFVADFYQQGLRDVPDQQVVVNYSRSEDRARDFAGRWDVPEWTTEWEGVIHRDDVDMVLIALPNHLHRDAAL
ncbi:MAG: gfo/Idh/MocA family oxidoreductase, partial [Armatimonadia bacterium]|nr:gfo/Idh/MocA family oxidoreductase [Armatimonadia bacterium]